MLIIGKLRLKKERDRCKSSNDFDKKISKRRLHDLGL